MFWKMTYSFSTKVLPLAYWSRSDFLECILFGSWNVTKLGSKIQNSHQTHQIERKNACSNSGFLSYIEVCSRIQ